MKPGDLKTLVFGAGFGLALLLLCVWLSVTIPA